MNKIVCTGDGKHEMLKSQKFCGECGNKALEAATDTADCGSCGAEMMKSHKFCSECATPAGPLTIDLDATLDEVDAFIKSAALIEADLHAGDIPDIDPDGVVDDEKIEAIMKSAAVVDRASGEQMGIDALPVVQEFLKGQALSSAQARTYHGHSSEMLAHSIKQNSLMLKSIGIIGRAVAALAGKVETVAGEPRPRREIRQLRPDGNNGNLPKRTGFDALSPLDLMTKSLFATNKDGTLLTATEIGSLESYTNGQLGLAGIRELDPGLAGRVERALAAVTVNQ